MFPCASSPGQRVGLHMWCHGLRHTAITTAIEKGQRAQKGSSHLLGMNVVAGTTSGQTQVQSAAAA
jgi:hypothetical protein